MTTFGEIQSDQAILRAIHFDAQSIGKGATAPTPVSIGTSPEVPALLFDATNETACIVASFRPDMDLGSNFTIKIIWALVATEIDLDQLDMTLNYVVTQTGVTGAGPAKTSTQLLVSQQVTTAAGLAIGDVYSLDVAIAFDDATNPLNASGASIIVIEFHLTNVTEIAAIHVLDVDIQYSALY